MKVLVLFIPKNAIYSIITLINNVIDSKSIVPIQFVKPNQLIQFATFFFIYEKMLNL